MSTVFYDPTDPTFWDRRTKVYRLLRDEHPVLHERGVWALSRFEDVHRAVTDPVTYSSRAEEAEILLPMMNYLDDPRHAELRRLVSRGFTPVRVTGMRPLIVETVNTLLDSFVANGGGDLVGEFSGPLAATVVGRMIGIPSERIGYFRHLTDQFLPLGQSGATDALAEVAASIYGMFGEVVAARREDPGDDLISALIALQSEGSLSDEELLGFCFLLVGGGNDTTTHLIANGWVLLQDNPGQLALLQADRSLLPNAIEEMLRMEPPAENHARHVSRDVELHGTTIPAGARVQILWGAANLDEREFPDPDTFDITRQATRHLAFGFGPHYCLGAALARLEAQIAFEALLDRLGSSKLAARPQRFLSPWACAYQSVEIAV